MATETLSHSQSMIRLLRSYIATRVIYVAAKLGLADHIRDDGASAQDLAQKLNVHPGRFVSRDANPRGSWCAAPR